ncbi:hypothetical protein OG897_29780 [Streptomyces sp. NBC_00237]|uniref:hypothetical protein n=1 Tax=Streptomyces sp. NBC_00237 TaxID=2975687 RepID=UPI002250E254|nr:hypothetical protein [Streptomyces sp. NBC_00237]MCX5205635.1 hypothetical protein [Streptomyces sp. NBC_00237]
MAPTFTSVRSGAVSGCRRCGRAAAGERRRIAGQEKAEADMRIAGFEPLEPYPGARMKWHCLHTACGRTVRPRLTKIRSGGGGCRACAGRAPVDPATAEADMRAVGMEPLEPFPGRVGDRWKCRCVTCGHTGMPTLNNIRRGQGGCYGCARRVRQSRFGSAAERFERVLAAVEGPDRTSEAALTDPVLADAVLTAGYAASRATASAPPGC